MADDDVQVIVTEKTYEVNRSDFLIFKDGIRVKLGIIKLLGLWIH